MNIAVVLFDGAEELDWAGPWEVLAAWRDGWPDDGVQVFTVAWTEAPIVCAKGLRVLADHTWETAPEADVVVWPGGIGTRPMLGDVSIRKHVQDLAARAEIMASVCTGSLVYADAGLLAGRRATTHWGSLDRLAELGAEVDPDARFVDHGDVVTAAGVSAGIDMALHLVARLHSRERAVEVRRYIQYDPEPPI
ncbi:MAG TPA: DJ-1/PfpI family protein [Gaiellaceae bacterium]|jgi:transcriptional regulator GlxA family with amidase domain